MELNSGDIAWVLTSTALVLFMTAGLAFFYGGMVRSKNMLGMLMQNFFAMGLIGVLWVAGRLQPGLRQPRERGLHRQLRLHRIQGRRPDPPPEFAEFTGSFIPLILFAAFQMTFAIITPALITGATADRLKFGAYAVFIGIWLIVVYAPLAHMVFAGGWLASMGALDFAGGAVVHMNAGAAALAVVLIIGKRKGWPDEPMPPHTLPWTLIGTGILWFGWAGFNAGSALGANGVAAQALLNTFVAASAAMLGWLLVERLKDGHATTLGAASGAVAGLVAITPCAGFVGSMPAIIIGFAAGAVCFLALGLKKAFKFDDALDVIAVHLIGGLLGTLMLGLFADPKVNGLVTDPGLFITDGGGELLKDQAVAAVVTIAYSFVVSFILAKAIDLVMGLRVSEDEEDMGLDQTQHAESAYA